MDKSTRGTNGHKRSDPGFIVKVEIITGFVSGLDTRYKRKGDFKNIYISLNVRGKAGAESINLGHLHIDDISSYNTT